MLNIVIITTVVLAIAVFIRLVWLHIRGEENIAGYTEAMPLPVPVRRETETPIKLVVKSYMFVNFDYRTGPKDPMEFYESFYVNLGPSDSAEVVRSYTLWVSTPYAVQKLMRANQHDFKWGRNLLLVERFDMSVILRAVEQHLAELHELAEDIG